MGRPVKYTRERILFYAAAGYTATSLASLLHIEKSDARRLLRKYGVPPKLTGGPSLHRRENTVVVKRYPLRYTGSWRTGDMMGVRLP